MLNYDNPALINNFTLNMKYFTIIILSLYLTACSVVPMSKKPDDIILTTRGHDEEVKKDPN